MKEIISFLRRLQCNNNREWFNAHKEEFLKHQARFHELVEEVIKEIATFDSDVANLTPKDCTYRIYRDVRFSSDKSPYKCHFGAFITKGGKKSGYSGYYFHISTGGGEEYPYCHMLAAGDYCCEPKVLKILGLLVKIVHKIGAVFVYWSKLVHKCGYLLAFSTCI